MKETKTISECCSTHKHRGEQEFMDLWIAHFNDDTLLSSLSEQATRQIRYEALDKHVETTEGVCIAWHWSFMTKRAKIWCLF